MSRYMIPEAYRPWSLLLGMIFLVILVNIDFTAVNIALILISKDLDADLNKLQWLLSGYILAWAGAVVAAGKLADIFGKRRILLLGIIVFSFASLWCGLAQSDNVLIAGRLIQGIGGALFVPPIYTLVFSVFPQNKQGMAIGALGAGVGIGLAMGPTFGGALLAYVSWRWIFLINVPLCLLTLVVTMLCTEKEPRRTSDEKFDVVGSILLGGSLGLMVYGLNEMERWGLFSLGVWSLIGLGALVMFIFAYTSKNKENRLIPKGLFSNKTFVGSVIGYTAVEIIFSMSLVMVGLYLQNVLSYSVYESGIIFLAMTLAYGLLSPLGGKMVDHMDARIPAVIGLVTLAIGTGLGMLYTTSPDMHILLPSLALIGVGLGIALPSYNAIMMKSVDSSILSTASGVFIMFAALGGSLGVVISTSLLVGLGEPILTQMTIQHGMDLSSVQLEHLLQVFGSAYRDLQILTGMNVDLAVKLMNEAFVQANWWNMLWGSLACAIALVVSIRMIKVTKGNGA